jgi:hypothetical protein
MNHDPAVRDQRSLSDLIKELRDETSDLMRQELALAKVEMSEKAEKTGRNIGYLAIGGAVAGAGFMFLLWALSQALVLALADTELKAHSLWAAPLIVGAGTAIFGYSLIEKALKTLKNSSLVPKETIKSLKEDKEWAREKVTG